MARRRPLFFSFLPPAILLHREIAFPGLSFFPYPFAPSFLGLVCQKRCRGFPFLSFFFFFLSFSPYGGLAGAALYLGPAGTMFPPPPPPLFSPFPLPFPFAGRISLFNS